MATAPQQQGLPTTHLVEEKYFRIKLERDEGLLKTAVEDAIGSKLDELAEGMWSTRVRTGRGQYKEITVRALPTDQGTSVEIRIEHGQTPLAVGIYGIAIIATSILVFPLFYIIAQAQERQKRLARERLIEMHKIWTEIAHAVGAPTKSGYRDRPEPARLRVGEEAEVEEQEADEEKEDARSS